MRTPDILAIIAGNGIYPQLLARSARAAGVGKIVVVAFDGETDPVLAKLVEEIAWLRVGQLSRMLSLLRQWQIRDAIMAGQIAPRNLFDLRPDWRALLLLARLKQRNAESIFGAIAAELSGIGVELLPATTFLEHLLAPKGLIAGPKLTRHEKEGLEFAWNIARQIAALDIGQTIVVKNGTVLAVEGLDGTNETIRRGGVLARTGAIVVKVAKPGHDVRFDIPVIGIETIRAAADARARVIAIEAERTLLLEKEKVIAAAESENISLVGR